MQDNNNQKATTSSKVFDLPTDKILSFDEFKELVQNEISPNGMNNSNNISGEAVIATTTIPKPTIEAAAAQNNNNNNGIVENPWQAPPRANNNNNNNNNNPLLPNANNLQQEAGDADRRRNLDAFWNQVENVLNQMGGPQNNNQQQQQQQQQQQRDQEGMNLFELNRLAREQQQQQQQEPAIVRFTPGFLKPITRFLYSIVSSIIRLILNLLGVFLPFIGGIVLLLVVTGGDISDTRFWKMMGFFVVLKIAKFIADRVRVNVVLNREEREQQQQQQQQHQQQQNGNQNNNNNENNINNNNHNIAGVNHHNEDINNNNNDDGGAAAAAAANGNINNGQQQQQQQPRRPPPPANLFRARLIKCCQVFFVSLSPSFRLERLMRELHEEGLEFN